MSAAVIILRRRQFIRRFAQRGATSPEEAIALADVGLLVPFPCGPEVPGAEWVDEENYRRHVDAKRCEPRAVRRRVVWE
jgi:hypothetical protein